MHTHVDAERDSHRHGCTHTHGYLHTASICHRGSGWWHPHVPLHKESQFMGQQVPGGIHHPTCPEKVEQIAPAHKSQAGSWRCLPPSLLSSHPGKAVRMDLSAFTSTCQVPSPYFYLNDLLRAPRSSSSPSPKPSGLKFWRD